MRMDLELERLIADATAITGSSPPQLLAEHAAMNDLVRPAMYDAWSQMEVRTCRQEGTAWELGCQFVRTPSWNVLLLFG